LEGVRPCLNWSDDPIAVRSDGAQECPMREPTTLFTWWLINSPMASQMDGVRAHGSAI
jgi:hypothetical protein